MPAFALGAAAPDGPWRSAGRLPDGEATVYGFLRYDTRIRSQAALTKFATNAPEGYQLVNDYGNVFGTTPVFTAGTFVGKDYLVYETTLYQGGVLPHAFSVVNPETGALDRKSIIEIPENATSVLIFDEMTYDPKTGRLFGIRYSTSELTSDLYEIDQRTYETKMVAGIPRTLFTLTADNGYLYAVEATQASIGGGAASSATALVRIPQSSINASRQTCTVETVKADLGVTIGNYSQSMEFDKTTHRLWWFAQTSDGGASLIELDPASGDIVGRTVVAGNPQFIALGIPYQFVPDGAPSFARNFSLVSAARGGTSATIAWTNPSVDYRNNPLASLSGARLYRNGQLVRDFTDRGAGEGCTYSDTGLSDGLYTYRLVPYNGNGEGVYVEDSVYVGMDTPGAPLNVRLTADGNRGTITWDAPNAGAHDGYFDASTLRYDVERLPDNVPVASGITARTASDQVSVHAGYSYRVTAYNGKGRGASAVSNIVAYGTSEAVPFISPLSTQADFDRWTVMDANNDGLTWAYNVYDHRAVYDRGEVAANDWLISPPLEMKAGNTYQLRYTYASANWVDMSRQPIMEKMRVLYGEKPSPDALTTVVKETGEFHTASNLYYYGKDNFVAKRDGSGYIAFQACSDADKGQIYLSDVSLREYSATDLSVRILRGSTTANANKVQTFTATVGNEGSAPVGNYRVELVDAITGAVLGQSEGVNVPVDATVDVSVNWTPAATGTCEVRARVVLEGDTYPADNLSPETIEVTVDAEDANQWLTVNTYNQYGWDVPFYLASPYSKTQCLYLESELQRKDVNYTALQFHYLGKHTGSFTFPAKVSIKATDRSVMHADDSEWRGDFDDEGFTEVFSGNLTIEGPTEDGKLIVPLDKPFAYKGGNLIFQFVSQPVSPIAQTAHPDWHFCEGATSRSAYYDGSSEPTEASDVWAFKSVPFLMIEFAEASGIGTISVGEPLGARLVGTSLLFDTPFKAATLYTLTGEAVRQARDADRVSVAGLKAGVYMAQVDGHTMKFVIK